MPIIVSNGKKVNLGGSNLPIGGFTGQVLAKASDEDLDVIWMDSPEQNSNLYSNQNLLDDAHWINKDTIINQKGQNLYTDTYCIDRWYLMNGCSCAVGDDGITLTYPGGQAGTYIMGQAVEFWKPLRGRTMTVSALIESANIPIWISAQTHADYSGNVNSEAISAPGLISATFVVPNDAEMLLITFTNMTMQVGSVKPLAAKLELGPVQTLAHQDEDGNWVLNDPPPNYALELAKCQRYQQVLSANAENVYAPIGVGTTYDTTTFECIIPLPVTLRSKPTVAMTGTYFIRGAGIAEPFSISGNIWPAVYNFNKNFVSLVIDGVPELPTNHAYALQVANDPTAKIIFDANM